ncbi:hypothetical protein SDC9_123554 [bioreactor metagenome]|uniref:Uncharacterized protein n=1 Tax=bioreactor metagenome TaxID=1076179 RepID=A0A645CHY5_9ZZZZ
MVADGMRPDGRPAGGFDRLKRLFGGGQDARHIGRGAALQQPFEHFEIAGKMVTVDQRPREMGPARRFRGPGLQQVGVAQRITQCFQPLAQQLGPAPPFLPHRRQKIRQPGIGAVQKKSDHMDFPRRIAAGELHSGDQFQLRKFRLLRQKIRDPGDGVVIGQGQRVQPRLAPQRGQLFRRHGAVGRRAVNM